MILVIDNYDSFAHNLARHMEMAGWETRVARNDAISLTYAEMLAPQAIIVSPGPKGPESAGVSMDLIKRMGPYTPVLGICLGHQCIAAAFGAKITAAKTPMHGRASIIRHQGDELFAGVPEEFEGGRYHSLAVEMTEHAPLRATAHTQDGEVMALRHDYYPVFGVQFHPESVLTPQGMNIVRNFTNIALARRAKRQTKVAA